MPTRKKPLPRIQRLEFEPEKEKVEQSQPQAKPQEGEKVEHRQEIGQKEERREETSHEEPQVVRPEIESEGSDREEPGESEEEIEEEVEKELENDKGVCESGSSQGHVPLNVSDSCIVFEDVTTVTYLSHIFEAVKRGRFVVEDGFLILYPEGSEADISISMVKIPIGELSASVNAQLKATVRSLEDVKKLKEFLKPLTSMRVRVVAELEV